MSMQSQTSTTDFKLNDRVEAAATDLDGVIENLSGFEGPACDAVKAAAERIADSVKWLRSVGRDYGATLRSAGAEIRRAAERERQRIPTTGWASAADREAALRASDSAVALQVGTQSAATVAAAHAVEAGKQAAGAAAAMSKAKDAIDRQTAEVKCPIALRIDLDANQLAKVTAIAAEYKSALPSELKKTYDGIVASGDETKTELFCLAVTPLLEDLCRSTVQATADRLSLRMSANERNGGIPGREREAAAALLRQIQADRAARVPEDLLAAQAAFDQLLPLFSRLFGFDQGWLGRAELMSRRGSSQSPLAIDSRWFQRALPTIASR